MVSADFLVIGSGITGLIFALDVAERGRVIVVCKQQPSEGSTRYAQGGIASVSSPLDSFESHIADTLEAGAGICHEDAVRALVTEGPSAINRLVQLGTQFDRHAEHGEYELGREGGHSARRILHARDATGAEIQRALYEAALEHPNIEIRPYHIAIDFITRENTLVSAPKIDREVLGIYALDQRTEDIVSIGARITMLATGGCGKVYLYTSNPDVSTGGGIAMAYRAGARIANMEFIQFHPTCLFHPKAKSFLITEAMRGEGARLLNAEGTPFMQHYDPREELAPRDIVARAIDDQMKRTGDEFVLLDISHQNANFIRERFPTIYDSCRDYGIDITKEPIPVVPAAHYCCGGVATDIVGQTDLARLYAGGETAFTGVHGANRLASNSLLEACVYAQRAARHCLSNLDAFPDPGPVPEWDYLNTVTSEEAVLVSHYWDEVRRFMSNLVGVVRSNRRLELARHRIDLVKAEVRDYYWKYRLTSDLIELRNLIEVADLIVHCASQREESRGLHYSTDYPERDDINWHRDTVIKRELVDG